MGWREYYGLAEYFIQHICYGNKEISNKVEYKTNKYFLLQRIPHFTPEEKKTLPFGNTHIFIFEYTYLPIQAAN